MNADSLVRGENMKFACSRTSLSPVRLVYCVALKIGIDSTQINTCCSRGLRLDVIADLGLVRRPAPEVVLELPNDHGLASSHRHGCRREQIQIIFPKVSSGAFLKNLSLCTRTLRCTFGVLGRTCAQRVGRWNGDVVGTHPLYHFFTLSFFSLSPIAPFSLSFLLHPKFDVGLESRSSPIPRNSALPTNGKIAQRWSHMKLAVTSSFIQKDCKVKPKKTQRQHKTATITFFSRFATVWGRARLGFWARFSAKRWLSHVTRDQAQFWMCEREKEK